MTVRHEYLQGGEVRVLEEQDIVYRDAPTEPTPLPSPEPDGDDVSDGDAWTVPTDPTLLFRYSALTYNGHRIHYDRDYARDVELYPGLVVHGPLQAVLMAEAVRREVPQPAKGATLAYRLLAPAFDGETLRVTGGATPQVAVGGRVTASATWAP